MAKLDDIECESKNLLKSNIDWDNPSQVLEIISKVLVTDDSDKIKLFILGEILTKNKNVCLKNLRDTVTNLNKKISNQRKHINKLTKDNDKLRNRKNNSPKSKHLSADDIALQKAKAAYDSQFNQSYVQPKKKFIVHKKPRNSENQ